MPRSSIDPFIKVVQWFEDAPLATLPISLSVVKEVVRRRLAGETVVGQDGTARIDPPLAKPRKKWKMKFTPAGPAPAVPVAE